MKTIFSSPDLLLVRAAAAYLHDNGFDVLVEGEARLGAAGGLPPTDCWPELRLLNDAQEDEAIACVAKFKQGNEKLAAGTNWNCPKCGQSLEPQFTECWNCQETNEVSIKIERTSALHRCYYFLLLVEVILTLAIPTLAQRDFDHFPKEIQQLISAQLVITARTGSIQLIFLLMQLASWFGLLIFANYSRYLFAITWLLATISWAIELKFTALSIVTLQCLVISGMVGGALLALAFHSPLANDFTNRKEKTSGNVTN